MDKDRRKKIDNNKSKKTFWGILCLLAGMFIFLYPKRKRIKKIALNEKDKCVSAIEKEYGVLKHGVKKFPHRVLMTLKDVFVPHEGNNHKPKALHPKSLKAYVILLVLIKIFVTGFIFFTYPNPARLSEKIANEVFSLTNQSRQSEGVDIVTWNDSLTRAAQNKAQDMINNNYFSHVSPDGTQPWQWINKGEYSYVYMGENLAMDFSSAEIAHSAFKKSPTHWKNIMNSKYSDMGIGVAVGEIDNRQTIVLVEFFGTAKAPAPQLVKAAEAAETEKQDIVPIQEEQPKQEIEEIPVVKDVVKSEENKSELDDIKEDIIEPSVIGEIYVEEDVVDQVAEDQKIIANQDKVAAESDTKIAYEPIAQKLVPEITVPKVFSASQQLKVVPIEQRNISKGMVDYVILYGRYIMLLFLLVLMAILLVNILIKPHIQHSGLILQTVALIIVVSAFLFVRFHFIEDLSAVIIY